jgi:hypothetical protein
VPVTFGIHASACASLSIVVGVLAVSGGVLATRRRSVECRFADLSSEWLLGRRSGDVSLGRRIISQRGVVIAAISCSVARVGGIVTPVSGPIAFLAVPDCLIVNQDGGPMYCLRECSVRKATAARRNVRVAHSAPAVVRDRYPRQARMGAVT